MIFESAEKHCQKSAHFKFFLFSLSIFLFPCLTALARTSSSMLSGSGERARPILKEKHGVS